MSASCQDSSMSECRQCTYLHSVTRSTSLPMNMQVVLWSCLKALSGPENEVYILATQPDRCTFLFSVPGSVALSCLNLASRCFSKLSRAQSASNCSGVPARNSQATHAKTVNTPRCVTAVWTAIQLRLHGLQNGSLLLLGVAAHRVVKHWDITSGHHARIFIPRPLVRLSSDAIRYSQNHNSHADQESCACICVLRKHQRSNRNAHANKHFFFNRKVQQHLTQHGPSAGR